MRGSRALQITEKDLGGSIRVEKKYWLLEPAPQGMGAAKRSTGRQHTSRKPVKTQNPDTKLEKSALGEL